MRYGRYLRLEKNIAASDTGGILERWRYGRRLLMDGKATTPAGNFKHGVLATLIAEAAAGGYEISEREIRYRLQAAKTYATEAEIGKAIADFRTWFGLIEARFPPVELPPEADPGEPYDPRDTDEKWRDFENERKRREADNVHQGALFDLPSFFSHDTYGPRTRIGDLIAVCDESERMTANFVKRDAERRAYADELEEASGGNLDMSWYEAEGRRRGLHGLGLTSWDEFDEIIASFFGRDEDPDGGDDE